MDLLARVANLEQANRRWKLWSAVVVTVWPVLVIACGMSIKATSSEDVADEIRTRKLMIIDDAGNVVCAVGASGMTMQRDNYVTKISPADISVTWPKGRSVKIRSGQIELCEFDAEKFQRHEELLKQRRRDGLTEEEVSKIVQELRKNDYEPQLVTISRLGNAGCVVVKDVLGRGSNALTVD